jgi:hypothetical protein
MTSLEILPAEESAWVTENDGSSTSQLSLATAYGIDRRESHSTERFWSTYYLDFMKDNKVATLGDKWWQDMLRHKEYQRQWFCS